MGGVKESKPISQSRENNIKHRCSVSLLKRSPTKEAGALERKERTKTKDKRFSSKELKQSKATSQSTNQSTIDRH